MARRPRAQKFETRTARTALAARGKPYRVATLARGITLLYRRNKKPPNPWVVKVADGHSGAWTGNISPADDVEDANGKTVLDYPQAISAALAMARGSPDNVDKPATWATALDDYGADLRARNGDPTNASRVRKHLSATLLSRPVALLTATELRRWRNNLVESGLEPGTIVRVLKA